MCLCVKIVCMCVCILVDARPKSTKLIDFGNSPVLSLLVSFISIINKLWIKLKSSTFYFKKLNFNFRFFFLFKKINLEKSLKNLHPNKNLNSNFSSVFQTNSNWGDLKRIRQKIHFST